MTLILPQKLIPKDLQDIIIQYAFTFGDFQDENEIDSLSSLHKKFLIFQVKEYIYPLLGNINITINEVYIWNNLVRKKLVNSNFSFDEFLQYRSFTIKTCCLLCNNKSTILHEFFELLFLEDVLFCD